MAYGSYFKDYQKSTMDHFGFGCPSGFESSTLLADFEEALLAASPRLYITIAPLAFKVGFVLLKLMPGLWKDGLFDLITCKLFKIDATAHFKS